MKFLPCGQGTVTRLLSRVSKTLLFLVFFLMCFLYSFFFVLLKCFRPTKHWTFSMMQLRDIEVLEQLQNIYFTEWKSECVSKFSLISIFWGSNVYIYIFHTWNTWTVLFSFSLNRCTYKVVNIWYTFPLYNWVLFL